MPLQHRTRSLRRLLLYIKVYMFKLFTTITTIMLCDSSLWDMLLEEAAADAGGGRAAPRPLRR